MNTKHIISSTSKLSTVLTAMLISLLLLFSLSVSCTPEPLPEPMPTPTPITTPPEPTIVLPDLTYSTPSDWPAPLVLGNAEMVLRDTAEPNDTRQYIGAHIKNSGEATAEKVVVALGVRGNNIHIWRIPRIAPGVSIFVNVTVEDLEKTFSLKGVRYKFGINIDPADSIKESDETNNKYGTWLQVEVVPTSSTPEFTPVPVPEQEPALTPINPRVSVEKAQTTIDEVITVDIMIHDIARGLSGYDITVRLDNAEIAQIVDIQFADFGLTDIGDLPNSTVRVRAIDLKDVIPSGTKEALLATLKLQGRELGTSAISVTIHAMDDDSGNAIEPETAPSLIEVVSTQSTSKEVPVPLPPTPSPVPDSPVSPSPPSAPEPEPTPALIERGTTLWLWIVIAFVVTSLVVTIGWRLRRRASVTFTTQALATRMGISPKKLRSFIKAEYPGELRGKKWYISSDLAKKVEKSYKAKIKARKVPPLNGSP